MYLNAAGHGLPCSAVRQRMISFLQRQEEIGVVAAEAEVAAEMAEVRPNLARLLDVSVEDIAFVDWGTLAWNAAVLSMRVEGRRVLVAPGEWSSSVALLQRMGAIIEVMPLDGEGHLDMPALSARIDNDLAGIFTPMVSSLTGEISPVAEIGALARPDECLYVVDASQALGQMKVSMPELGCDILVAPTRKWLRGPKGTGVLAVRRRALKSLSPSRVADDGRLSWAGGQGHDVDDATRFEKLGHTPETRLGLGVALENYLKDPAAAHGRIMELADSVRRGAGDLGFDLAGVGSLRSGITTLRGPSDTIEAAFEAAKSAGFTVKMATPDCEPLRLQDSVEGGFLRISPHVYNSETEIDALFDVVRAAV